MKIDAVESFFQSLPLIVDPSAIRDQWVSLAHTYNVNNWQLPLPIWRKRGFDYSGEEAWRILHTDLNRSEPVKPFCIYLHAPFCSSKCGFCDSYSFRLQNHKDEHIHDYVRLLCDELCMWAQSGNLAQRPVSTVHLGGGTPTFLGEAALGEIVECIKENFHVSPDTEWAVESTVASLSPSMVETLDGFGFRRLHIGVQSLEDNVRRVIGRRSNSDSVVRCIRGTLDIGWIVSVDLICGLPDQSLEGFLRGIQDLINIGVNGFSIYELLIFAQNQKWAELHDLAQRDHVPNYFMFQAGACLLLQNNFSLNHFNHWADSRDHNIYFTAPSRGEDCLAVGTIADGVFGDVHYRHPRYASYMASVRPDNPGLVGGLRRTALENAIQPFITAVYSGYIDPEISPYFAQISKTQDSNFFERWQQAKLITRDASGGFVLTPNGSWFTGNMVNELLAIIADPQTRKS